MPRLPSDYQITQEYGWTPYALSGAYNGLPHNGIDFGNPTGSQVIAPANLRITEADWDNSGFGWHVRGVDPWGFEHLFGHLYQFLVSVGQQTIEGQPLALSDSSGNSTAPHLHWSVRPPGGAYYYFVNPHDWLAQVGGGSLTSQNKIIDMAYREIYGRGADASALKARQGQTAEQIEADLWASKEYADDIKRLVPGYPDAEIEKKRAAHVPVYQVAYEVLKGAKPADAATLQAKINKAIADLQ